MISKGRTPRQGVIRRIRRDCMLLDLGHDRQGIITHAEMRLIPGTELYRLRLGQEVTVYLDQHLSKVHDAAIQVFWHAFSPGDAWEIVADYKENETWLEVPIIGHRANGLLTDLLGLGGFLPYTMVADPQVKRRSPPELQSWAAGMVGRRLEVRVQTHDVKRRKLILTQRPGRKPVIKTEEEFLANLRVGEVLTGTVVKIVDYGLFVDVGPMTGLVHKSEVAWSLVTNLGDHAAVGARIDVQVIQVDMEKNRFALSVKALLKSPWQALSEKHAPGDILDGRVHDLVDFGVLVDVGGVIGLLHVSKLSEPAEPATRFTVGEPIRVRLLSLDVEGRKAELGEAVDGQRRRLDLNRAVEHELTRLPGIGPRLAAEIASYRSNIGGFNSIDELLQVRGIGPQLLAQIRKQAVVTGRDS